VDIILEQGARVVAGLISQGQGAEIAHMSRADFIQALSAAGVSPFQETLEEVRENLLRG
jgi:hypothetical protein